MTISPSFSSAAVVVIVIVLASGVRSHCRHHSHSHSPLLISPDSVLAVLFALSFLLAFALRCCESTVLWVFSHLRFLFSCLFICLVIITLLCSLIIPSTLLSFPAALQNPRLECFSSLSYAVYPLPVTAHSHSLSRPLSPCGDAGGGVPDFLSRPNAI